MTQFRPCIDLRSGRVVQIVGGTLRDDGSAAINFESDADAATFARRYRADGLLGGHVIMLGPGNELAARRALAAWPGGLQIGGGISTDNAAAWLAAGAAAVIVTSALFEAGCLSHTRLQELSRLVGRNRLVVDLSCRRIDGGWCVATNRWQTLTDLTLSAQTLATLANYCAEFLVHAADIEGLRGGIDTALVQALAEWSPIPVTYAGGARNLEDLCLVEKLSQGRVDLTIGSALDLFGGDLPYDDCVSWNRSR